MKEISVKLEGKEWEEILKHVFEHKKSDLKVDGFRKGQVPFDVYVKKFGIESLFMDAIDHALPVMYDKMINENKDLEMAARPTIDVKAVDKDHVEVMFGITLKPEVKLGKYKDLKIKKEEAKVTEEEIEHELFHIREEFVELKNKEGKAALDDEVTIDFEGFKDNVPFEGGKGEDYPLVLGSHSFIPGFEEGIVGMSKGETKDLDLSFPENYHSEELKGAKVVFKVTVKEIKERILPEYNDEFFKDLNMEGVNSLETLKEDIKSHILAHKTTDIENEYFEKCLDKVCESAKMEVPETMINDEIDRIADEFDQRLKMQGMSVDNYIKMLGTTREEFVNNFRPEAEKRVKYRLVIDEVVKEENIVVEAKEVEEYLKNLSAKYKVSEEEFLKEIGGKEFLEYDLKVRKATEIITK